MRPPLRSTPPSTPSPYRYLGRGGGERPVRVQLILALVAALVLVAVPLYLWRRPRPADLPTADAATAPTQAPATPVLGASPQPVSSDAAASDAVPRLVVPPSTPKVEVSPVKTLKCQDPGPGRTPAERCDGIRFFEDGLVRAIKDSSTCATPSRSGLVASYVLEMHFGKRRTNLFFGKSTNVPKGQRKELLRCVERALPTPDWDRIPHQHLRYTINAAATYPPADASEIGELAPAQERPASAPATRPKSDAPARTSPRSGGTKGGAKPAPKKKSR